MLQQIPEEMQTMLNIFKSIKNAIKFGKKLFS